MKERTSGKSLQSCSPHPEKEAIFRNDKRQFTLVVQQVWSHSAASNFAIWHNIVDCYLVDILSLNYSACL